MQKTDSDVAGWNVLIIDDEPDNIGVIEGILTFYDAEVHCALDGRSGLESIKKLHPTFVLLDISMPYMDGWKLLKAVRADPEIASIPVIALTAHAMPGDKEKGLEAGFDGYITKPVEIMKLIDQIKGILLNAAQARTDK